MNSYFKFFYARVACFLCMEKWLFAFTFSTLGPAVITVNFFFSLPIEGGREVNAWLLVRYVLCKGTKRQPIHHDFLLCYLSSKIYYINNRWIYIFTIIVVLVLIFLKKIPGLISALLSMSISMAISVLPIPRTKTFTHGKRDCTKWDWPEQNAMPP